MVWCPDWLVVVSKIVRSMDVSIHGIAISSRVKNLSVRSQHWIVILPAGTMKIVQTSPDQILSVV